MRVSCAAKTVMGSKVVITTIAFYVFYAIPTVTTEKTPAGDAQNKVIKETKHVTEEKKPMKHKGRHHRRGKSN